MPSEIEFKKYVADKASRAMVALLGSQQGRRAGARIALAFAQAAQAAKRPDDLYRCSGESIAGCIATAAETGIYPGGPHPKAYLIPRGGALQYEITHRGIAVLAQRAGYGLRPIPVHIDDPILSVQFGEVIEHEADPDRHPQSLDDLRGVYVCMTRLSDGANMGRPWIPVSVLRTRAESRQAGPVWRQWPVEMAMKTAIKYAVARGMLVIDSDALDSAFAAEAHVVEPEPRLLSAPTVKRSALPDPDARVPDVMPSPAREPVHVASAPAPAAQAPAPAVDLGAIKSECADLERQVGAANVASIRGTGLGPDGDADVTSWRGRADSATAYRDALRSAAAPPDEDEVLF